MRMQDFNTEELEVFLKSTEFKRWFDRCVAFVMSYVGSLSEAENIASESLLALWEKQHKGEEVEAPLPFIFGVARNKALNFLRHKYVVGRAWGRVSIAELEELQSRISSLDSCDPHTLYSSEVRDILHNTLSQLGEKTKRAFLLSRFSGKTNHEIARELGIGDKAVEYHITKAIRAIRTALKDYLP